jgi:phosphate transport system permease protein
MNKKPANIATEVTALDQQRPIFVTIVAILFGTATVAVIPGAILYFVRSTEGEELSLLQLLLSAVLVAAFLAVITRGLWFMRNWARTAVMAVLAVGLLFLLITVLFNASAEIFAGEQVTSLSQIFSILFNALIQIITYGLVPGLAFYGFIRYGHEFEETHAERAFADRSIRYILILAALSAIFIVFLIILFTMAESWEAIEDIGLDTMLMGMVWRPGSIIGTEDAQFGLIPMIVGSILSTLGAVVLGVPLSILTAILLAEVAPQAVREIVRPAVELLAGIPSVIYGLFGMVVLADLIRIIPVAHNTGFGVLNASIILAVMIIPTVTNISEDAIRAVPKDYKEGSLALGTTHWQTIWNVILPASRSGIIAAIILGIGRALGETMAVIMVIGNSIALPTPLTDNPLTIFLNTARTLTGNIAVEINYAAGAHRSALFFTGLLLFLMIFMVNSLARYLMRERAG